MTEPKLHYKLHKKAKSPKLTDCLYNIYTPESHILGPGETRIIDTGLEFWLEPELTFELLQIESLFNKKIHVGTFTSTNNGFIHKRGHKYKTIKLKVGLENKSTVELVVDAGHKITQLMIIKPIIFQLKEFKTASEKEEFEENFVKPIKSFPSGTERWFQQSWKEDSEAFAEKYLQTVEGEEAIEQLDEYKKTTRYINANDDSKKMLEAIYLWKIFKGDNKYDDILNQMEEDYLEVRNEALAK